MKKTRWIDWKLYRRLKLSNPGLLPDFGEIIRARRADLGISRAELAERAGCHESTIYRIETAEGRMFLPRRDIFWGLGAGLGLTAAEMLEAAGYLEEVEMMEGRLRKAA